MLHLAICSPVFVPYQGGGTPLDSDLDQGAGEEAKARQVEPGGMEELWRAKPSLGNQVIVYPRQLRENFLVPHSSPGSLGEMKRPSGFSIGGTCWQWRSRGGRKQEQEDPEIVFPIIVIFVCFKVKVGAIWSPLSLFAGV